MTAGVGGVVAEDLVAEGRFDADRVALEGLPPDEALGAPVAIAGWREGHREDAFIIGRQLLVLALAAVMEVGRRLAVDSMLLTSSGLEPVLLIVSGSQPSPVQLSEVAVTSIQIPPQASPNLSPGLSGRAGALHHRRRRKGRRPSVATSSSVKPPYVRNSAPTVTAIPTPARTW